MRTDATVDILVWKMFAWLFARLESAADIALVAIPLRLNI
jgi:hypothetical protein